MRVSVVISTYNRANSLRETLLALRYQTHPDFEVVVVAGPCTDDTPSVLGEFAGRVRALDCPAVNLSVSRNIGISASAGDLCAFIDDDSLADPYWLEQLAEGFDRPETVGVGGLVYDPTGFALQESPAVVDRRGLAVHGGLPPFVGNNFPGSDQFLHLLGTNCCLRRDTLRQLGGFDEEYEYFLDETDICLRAIDAGGRLRRLDRAVVHHKFRASHLRNDQKVIRHPYPIIKNSYYFALKAARADDSTDAILTRVRTHVVEVLTANARNLHRDGRLSGVELAVFLKEVDQGMRDGLRRGLNAPRRLATIPAANPEAFLPFPTLRPEGVRRTVCIASQDMPSERAGGIGRAAWTLATSMAGQGHDVHFLTRTPDHNRVDFEAGVWVHRLEPIAIDDDQLSPVAARNLAHAAAVHAEARRVAELRPLDAVVVPLWDSEGYYCLHDPSLPTVLTLQTSMRTMAGLDPAWRDFPEIGTLLAMETACVTAARCVHGNTRETLAKTLADAGRPSDGCDAFVVPYGIADGSEGVARRRGDDGKVRVLFVGRLEHRKGTDLLLAAAAELCQRIGNIEFVMVGDPTIPASDGVTYRAAFERDHSELAGRVRFLGKLGDAELRQEYADCDVFCLPARYESFGLVLTEAMMFGKPVIAARAGGMVEIVAEGENGHLFAPGDAADLAAQLRKLLASAETRGRFGEESRRRYEQRFSTDVMVRNAIACHRDVIASHHRKAVSVADALADLIREVGGASKVVADSAVKELLTAKRGHEYIDYADEVRLVWDLPPVEFLAKVFHLFLGRPLDAVGLRHFTDDLANGVPRESVVRGIATSEEARLRKIDTAWLDAFAAPPSPPVPVQPPPRLSMKVQMKRAVKKVPGVGKGLRLLKQIAKLPRTVRDLANQVRHMSAVVAELNARASTGELEAAVRRLAEAQRDLSIQLGQLNDSASGRDRRTQWHLAAQAAKVEQLLAEVNRLRGVA